MLTTIAQPRIYLCATVCLIASLVMAAAANGRNLAGSNYSLIYSFCSQNNCTDGSIPTSGLTADASSNLYGITMTGGKYGNGTVFELVPGQNGAWTEDVLYSFCAKTNCSDGEAPVGKLVIDSGGRIYGVTQSGGAGVGIVYELIPNGGRTKWRLKVLHTFCAQGSPCTDGSLPNAGLSYYGQAQGQLYDGSSALYGTASTGGPDFSTGGVVFQLSLRSNGKWQEKTIYGFCSQANCVDGSNPESQLITDGKVLYGTTDYGGASAGGSGSVFKLVESHKKWTESVLYSFCVPDGCPDGAVPQGDLIMDTSRNLFGTTFTGGANNGGTIYEVTSNGVESVLYSFCSQANCTDGKSPYAGLIQDAAGNLYGTTAVGGAYSYGAVFEMGKSFQLLYSFCQEEQCDDGEYSHAPLLLDSSGNLFGVTTEGAARGNGGVFNISIQH